MQGEDLPPPSYDESTPDAPQPLGSTSGDIGLSAVSARRQPSASAQRALAPFSLVRTNEQVKGDYCVNISENKAAPDAVIKSTNGQLRACVYLQGVVPRTAEVLLETTNSSIATIFPDKDPEQPVTCSMRSTNGKVDVGFPTTYNGTITTRTTHGKINISDSMRANSVIVPNLDGSPSNLTTYRIRPQRTSVARDDKSDDDNDGADEILDTCHIQTTNSSITLAYISEVDKADNATDKKESSNCIIS